MERQGIPERCQDRYFGHTPPNLRSKKYAEASSGNLRDIAKKVKYFGARVENTLWAALGIT